MGRTRFAGPVYGAKQTLFSASRDTLSTGAGSGVSTTASATIVPVGEDWYATEFQAYRGSTGSSASGFWVQANSTILSSITITSTVADANSIAILTPDGGEKEGVRIASGSTVSFWYSNSSAQAAITKASWSLSGYRRFIQSSRVE
jgi:hypothetical protein